MLCFKTNKDIEILGFGTFTLDQYQKINSYKLNNFEVKISLFKGKDNTYNKLTEQTVFLNYIEQSNIPNNKKKLVEPVMFTKPILIKKEEIYTVTMEVHDTGCFYYLDNEFPEIYYGFLK